jgi:hypothetical protein
VISDLLSSAVFFYCASGLSVKSEIALPGLIPLAAADDPDVTVRHGPVPTAIVNASAAGPTWEIAGSRFLLRVPGIARFLLESGRDITVETENASPPSDIAIFLLGTVFGILLHQREHIVLHASAVRVNDKAVLFCGRSGTGKSTLAAALDSRGFDLVTDDLCAITTTAGGPAVQPDGRLLKLWAQTIDQLDLSARRREAVRDRLEKYYVEPTAASSAPLPLGAIYVLREARPGDVSGIERQNAVDAVVWVRHSAYRPSLVRRMGQRANYFHAATTIADRVGVFLLTRTLDFAEMPDVISRLERHWSEIGLTEHAA